MSTVPTSTDSRIRSTTSAPSPGPSGGLPHGLRLHFPNGLIGCPTWTDFQVQADPGQAPIVELACIPEPAVRLLVVQPHFIVPDYGFTLGSTDRQALALGGDEAPETFIVLVLRGDPPSITANLAGPLVINLDQKLGRQVVLDGDRYPLRFPVGG